MALDIRQLSARVDARNGFTEFTYTTTDDIATVEGAGYFNGPNILAGDDSQGETGDIIWVRASDGVNAYYLTISGNTVTLGTVTKLQLAP